MKKLFYGLSNSPSWFIGLLLKLTVAIMAFAALGFIYSSDAYAAYVLHGVDGGSTTGDGKFIWNRSGGNKCVDTVAKTVVTCPSLSSLPFTVGYLYKGPISGKFYKTATCWNKSTNLSAACSTAGGVITTSFTHHGILIEGGTFSLALGEINPTEQVMTVVPGALGTPIKVTIDQPDIEVAGFDQNNNNEFLGKGRFNYHVEYSIPLATLDPDNDNGHGNNTCGKCDPTNPGGKKACSGCVANQTCNNVAGTNEFTFTVKAFCQQGVTVEGYLTWIDPNPGATIPPDMPPEFTNCAADAQNCTLRVGALPGINGTVAGLPSAPNATVDPVACEEFFKPLTLGAGKEFESKQLLLFEQNYIGSCSDLVNSDPVKVQEAFGLESPLGAKAGIHRVCHSDYGPLSSSQGFGRLFDATIGKFVGFDDVQRGCVVVEDANGNPLYKVVEGEETAKAVEIKVEVSPESINLKCNVDPKTGQINDNGIATAKICGSAEFSVNNIAGRLNGGKIGTDAPVLTPSGTGDIVSAKPKSWSIATDTTGACSADPYPDLTLIYATCIQPLNGLPPTGVAQVIAQRNPNIVDGDIVTLTLQGKESGAGIPVIVQGADTAKVVKTP